MFIYALIHASLKEICLHFSYLFLQDIPGFFIIFVRIVGLLKFLCLFLLYEGLPPPPPCGTLQRRNVTHTHTHTHKNKYCNMFHGRYIT